MTAKNASDMASGAACQSGKVSYRASKIDGVTRNTCDGSRCAFGALFDHGKTSTLDAFLAAPECTASTALHSLSLDFRREVNKTAASTNLLAGAAQSTHDDAVTRAYYDDSGSVSDFNLAQHGQTFASAEFQHLPALREEVLHTEPCDATMHELPASRYVAVQDLIEYLHHERASHVDLPSSTEECAHLPTSSHLIRRRPFTVNEHLDAQGLLASVRSILRDDDALETIDLTDESAVHAGNLSTLFDQGDIPMQTAFDNFLQHDDDFGMRNTIVDMNRLCSKTHDSCATARATSAVTLDASRQGSTSQTDRDSLHNSFFINDYLGLSEGNSDDKPFCPTARHTDCSASVTHTPNTDATAGLEKVNSRPHIEHEGESAHTELLHGNRDSSGRSSSSSSSSGTASSNIFSDTMSVELPDDTCTNAQTCTLHTKHILCDGHRRCDRVMASRYNVEDLRTLVDESDDCVHAFALDCAFDYDADLLGAALRRHGPLECRLHDGT